MKPKCLRFAAPTLLLGASLVGASLTALSCSDSTDNIVSDNGLNGDSGTPTTDSASNNPKPASIDPTRLLAFAPLPSTMAPAEGFPTDASVTKARQDLGKQLYFDKRLSVDNTVSCNSCHPLAQYGVDNEPTSTGVGGQHGGRNAPTVYNAALHLWQFWDGRAENVEAQAKGPIANPVEMGMTKADGTADEEAIVNAINGNGDGSKTNYSAAFAAAFPGDPNPVSYDNIGKAIGAFERTLVTPSKWDQYLLTGDQSVLSSAERAGLAKFLETGCDTCHNGVAMGGRDFEVLGATKTWPDHDTDPDRGRNNVTKLDEDDYVFKVPSLRNIEKTGPYFHNGSVDKLEDAVSKMAYYQLGKTLSSDEVTSIVTFLKALTGNPDKDMTTPPELPKNNDNTDAPDPLN